MKKRTDHNIGLVLSGGGINGFSYLGVVSYLNDIQCLQDINTFVGTSAGGFICMLLALDLELQNIVDICNDIKFLQCFSDITMNIDQMFNSYGIIDTLELKQMIEHLFMETHGDHGASLTMQQAYEATGKECTVVSTDTNTMNPIYINHESHPDVKCVDAILATCAIPFLFPAVPIRDIHNKTSLAIDGAFVDNFAYEYAMCHYGLKPYTLLSVCIHIEKSINNEINNQSLFSYINGILYLVSTCIVYHQFTQTNDPTICNLKLNTKLPISNIVELNKHQHVIHDIIQEGYDVYSKYVRSLPNSIVTEYYFMDKYE